jgi:hypothetical protein
MLIAVGAILAWAVNAEVQGLDINAIGVILMVVGIVGLMFSLAFLMSFSPFGAGRHGSTDVHSYGTSAPAGSTEVRTYRSSPTVGETEVRTERHEHL